MDTAALSADPGPQRRPDGQDGHAHLPIGMTIPPLGTAFCWRAG